ncbi:MAG: ABC transporter permease [Actinomycetota bacterium]
MIALVIASTSLRRLVRDRTAMFFAVLLPLVVILIVGTAARGYDTFRVGVVGSPSGPLAQQLVAAVEADPAITTASIDDLTAAGPALRRGEVVAVLVVPQAYDAELLAGQTVTVDVLANRAESQSTAALTLIFQPGSPCPVCLDRIRRFRARWGQRLRRRLGR